MARAGVTVYRVVTVKRGAPTFIAVDGAMGDNLEVALYGQRFAPVIAGRAGVGARRARRPPLRVRRSADLGRAAARARAGDLVAVPVTGAYCFTTANNYNGALRPPVVFCRDGDTHAVVRRETYADLLARNVSTG